VSVIDRRHLQLAARREEFLSAAPFPHLVLDQFLDAEFFAGLKEILDGVTSEAAGKTFTSTVEEKKWISLNSTLPGAVREVVDALNARSWIENIGELTGLPELLSTSNDNTKLANYHVMEPGSVLGPHVDHASEPTLGLPHVLNVIVFLTESWQESAGGATCFFDRTGSTVVAKIPYKANRAVLFLHTPYSFHGVERVSRDAKLKRRTIYVDYYSRSYSPYTGMDLSFDLRWFRHGTTFKLHSPLDYLKPGNSSYTKALLQYHLNQFRARRR
jgi:2OG-Fe(II) oxygenase superfamily